MDEGGASVESVHVLLVRETDGNKSCCVNLSSDVLNIYHDKPFSERRTIMEEMGIVYRDLQNRFGSQIRLEIIDPRDILALFVILWQEGRRNRIGWKSMLRSMTRGMSSIAVFVNGELLAHGRVPSVETVSEKIMGIMKGTEE